jgi:hypothetical protein
MKTTLLLAAICVAVIAQARDVRSPDGKYAVRADATITLVDLASGNTLLVLSNDTQALTRVEVAWSPDSRKVAMVENARRGSAVFGAWTDGSVWHKTLQGEDEKSIISQAERLFGGRLVAENRVFNGWTSPDSIRVKGQMQFSSGRRCLYEYTLHFITNAVTHLDRGGYEEGAIVGRDHRLL